MRTCFLSSFVMASLLILLPGCSSGFSDFCEAKIACEGGNDKDIDACVEEAKGTESVAEAYGCGDEFDKMFECSESNQKCEDKDYSSKGACEDQSRALSACIKAASAKDD